MMKNLLKSVAILLVSVSLISSLILRTLWLRTKRQARVQRTWRLVWL